MPKWTMIVNDIETARHFNAYKHKESRVWATMTENGIIVATQYTAGPKVHLHDSSRLTVKNDNWPDTGVSKLIEDSCE